MSLCLSVSLAFSFACVGEDYYVIYCDNSFTFYVDFDVTQRRDESARGTATGDSNCLSYIPLEKMNKTGISGCGSFAVAYFQPATSINHLQLLVVVAVAAALVFLSALRKKNFQGLELTLY